MSKVWVKTQGRYDEYSICGFYVFGSIEAVNADKMQYEHEATQFVQYLLETAKIKLAKIEAERVPIRQSLNDIQAKLKEDKEKGIKNKENRKLNKQIEQLLCHYNEEIRKLESKILTYQHALIYPLEAIDMWMKEHDYKYEEYELIP